MITVRFSSGLTVQYNRGVYVRYRGGGQVSIYADVDAKDWIATIQRAADVIIEGEHPCRVYRDPVSDEVGRLRALREATLALNATKLELQGKKRKTHKRK